MKCFEMLDVDKNGFIRTEELKLRMMNNEGKPFSEAEWENFVAFANCGDK
jgi:Ca2+-binding EF-hand superfamily protein